MTLNPIWGNGNRTKKFKISEFKILVGTNVSHEQTVYIIISMYISKPLR